MMVYAIVVLLLTFIGSSLAKNSPIADTHLGKVRGYRATSRGGRQYLAFSGLPFAKPPLNALRFEPPQPAEGWTGIRNATEDGPYCTQYGMFEIIPKPSGVEDCLYLSLYTHSLSGNRPVLVHFHGGGYTTGNGARITGPQYFMDEDVIIVDVNYRLDMFGFLSFEDSVMPGNQGLKDQVMALKWIKRNIKNFGGDPNRITLIGESSGGGSVYHHTVSPLSKGLFHRGIAESGTSFNQWAVQVPGIARNGSLWLLSLLGCKYTTTQAAVSCLKSKDAYEIVSKTEYFRGWQIDSIFSFGPVLEPAGPGAFLVGPISKWKHNSVPLIIGMTSAEGLLRMIFMDYYNTSYPWFNENFEKLGPRSLMIATSSSNPIQVANSVKDYYFPGKPITVNDWVNLTMMYTDSMFTLGIIDGANKHSADVYFYYFDYVGEYSIGSDDMDARNNSLIIGAFHIDETIYLWHYEMYSPLKDKDLDLSKKLVKMWTDFAKNGCPTSAKSKVHWRKWSPSRHTYLNINEKGFSMRDGLAKDRYRFWKTLNYRDNYEKAFL